MNTKTTNPESLNHDAMLGEMRGKGLLPPKGAKLVKKGKPSLTTGTETAKPKKASAKKASAKKAAPRKAAPRKAAKARRGGGKALRDFTNTAKIRVLKAKELARKDCFRTGQTVQQNLAAQKAKGYRGRRKYIRKQVALKRISLS